MKPIRVEERRIRSFDGTELAYHVVGEGPAVLLANGLGGSWMAWKHQIRHLSDRYRFISWDYRGLYRSAAPTDPRAISVEHHARDALALIDAEQLDRVAIFGWSMGVQVGLELFRRAADRVGALVLINGVAGRPWDTALGLPGMGHVLPRLIRGSQAMPSLLQAATRRVVRWPETVTWAKRVGLTAVTLDGDLFHEIAGTFADLDMALYMRTLERLGEHDASDVLADIDVPTLIISGDRDLFTPRRVAERMAREVTGAEILVVAGGTHYVAVEYPELVNLRIDKFFAERGYGSPAAA